MSFDLAQSQSLLKEVDDQLALIEKILAKAEQGGGLAPPPPAPPPPGGGYVVEPGDDDIEVIREKPIGTVTWDRHRATIWAMPEPGKKVSGTAKKLVNYLIQLNGIGAKALAAMDQMNAGEAMWRERVAVVQKAAAESAEDIVKVEAALPAMRERRKKDKDVFDSIFGYTSAVENAQGMLGEISSAEKGLEQALKQLQSADLWRQANDKENEVADDKAAVEAKEAEIAEARKMIGEILDIAEKLVKQDWAGLAEKALSYARDKLIDASINDHYGKDLAELQAKLASSKKELKNLKIGAHLKAVEAARAGVEKAVQDLENVRKRFDKALRQIAQLQTQAEDTLNKSKATAPVGKMLGKRTKQLKAIDKARTACERYLKLVGRVREAARTEANRYGTIGSWLDQAAAADPAFDRSKPYARTIDKLALTNANELYQWATWLEFKESDCQKALAAITAEGKAGPLHHFNRAIDVAGQALVNAE